MIQKVVIAAVERRFGAKENVSEGLLLLSNNGFAYVLTITKFLPRCLGIVAYRTAVFGPQSNGMAERLVKTCKRDYLLALLRVP